MRDLYLKNGDGFLVVYSIVSKSTYRDLLDFIEQIYRVRDLDTNNPNDNYKIPIVIVGNKKDLEEQRVVTSIEGQQFAERFGFDFIETSAKSSLNVAEAYQLVIRKIRKLSSQKETNMNKKKKCHLF